MSSAWLNIPLEDYEGHMSSLEVGQLTVLAELFQCVLSRWRPASVAVLGVAGGNGLERIDSSVTKRIVGVDVNQQYLAAVEKRFGMLPGLELYCRDVTEPALGVTPVAMVHAALIFEHVGWDIALENALSLLEPEGKLSVVLQLPSSEEEGVASTKYTSLQTLKNNFALIDQTAFENRMTSKGFQLVDHERRHLPAGKALWLGVFARSAESSPRQ